MLQQLIPEILIAFFTALITWGFARGKSKQQIRALRIENDEKSAKYYQGLVDDLSTRVRELLIINKELIEDNKALIEELRKYKQLRKEPNKT